MLKINTQIFKLGNFLLLALLCLINSLVYATEINNQHLIAVKINKIALANKHESENRLSLNFQSIPIRAVLQLLAKLAHVNMVVSGSVAGNITLQLENIPWNQALVIIMKTNGLGEQKIGDTLIISPVKEIVQREADALQAQQKIQILEPLKSQLIQINYGKAGDIAALLKNSSQSILSKRGNVSVDARTNTLWIQDTQQRLINVRKLIAQLDVPVRQVLIEARIVNIDKNYIQQLGIRWETQSTTNINNTLNQTNQFANDYLQRLNVDLPAQGTGQVGGAASIVFALAKLNSSAFLDLELSALQTEGNARIISSPRLITANQQEAQILSGEEIPYQQATLSGATSVAFKNAVLSLKVTPQITPDNRIMLKLFVNQDKRGADVLGGIPTINTRQIQTQVLVNNGQTLVLGGIYQNTIIDAITKVPFFSEIPLLGRLFRYTDKETRQTELLIFVTPKIITQTF